MEPNLKELLKKQLLEKTALDTTYESDAGAILRKEMAESITDAIYQLAGNYRTMPHAEMVALCARIDGILNVSSILKHAKIIKDDLKEQLTTAE